MVSHACNVQEYHTESPDVNIPISTETTQDSTRIPRGGTNYRQHRSFYRYIRKRDNHTCQLCGHFPSKEVDHIIPFAEGGLTIPDNTRVLCSLCNRQTRRKRKDSRGIKPDPAGQKIKSLRLSLHLNQKEIADALGLRHMHISKVEHGEIHNGHVERIWNYLCEKELAQMLLDAREG